MVTEELKFEEASLMGPSKYKEYLSYFYGDYMTPPPENERGNRHKIIKVVFEEDRE